MVWGTYAVEIEVQMVFAQVGPEIKCPGVAVSVRGGGGNRYLGKARIDPATQWGFPKVGNCMGTSILVQKLLAKFMRTMWGI